MSTEIDSIISEEWSEMKEAEEKVLPENSNEVEPEQKHSHYNKTQLTPEEQLEKELAKLALVTAHNKNALQEMIMHTQNAENEVGLCLALVRADLKGKRNEPIPRREMINWGIMGQRIFTTLMQLETCQYSKEWLYKYPPSAENLGKILTAMSRQTKPSIRCYHCHEEGHLRRECPYRINKEKTTQTATTEKSTVSGQKLDEASLIEKAKLWPEAPDSNEDKQNRAMLAEQNQIENARVNSNPLL